MEPLSATKSFRHRPQQFKSCERLQDNIRACPRWHCSRCRSWSHDNKNAVGVFCKQKTLFKEYLISTSTFKGPRSAIGKGVYRAIFHIFGLHLWTLSVVYSHFESNLNDGFTHYPSGYVTLDKFFIYPLFSHYLKFGNIISISVNYSEE